jgi:UDP-N-acetylmuramoyl-L-alanyl-D-glutamate--2,6-diaminopimelate ligase
MKAVKQFAGLASDSREVGPGYLFAALPGTRANGAEFVKDAVGRGATAVLGRPEVAASAAALGVRFIADENPRLALARMAAQFFAAQPKIVAAVTGTNGKTSITVFLREIWTALGKRAASMGTIGVVTPRGEIKLGHTTPGPIELHRILAGLKHDGIDRLAVEASSHGLDQYRLDGADIAAVGFTNISRDHMDYHPTFEAYLACKLRLFTELAQDGAAAVVNADTEHAGDFASAAKARGLRLLTVGEKGEDLKLLARTPHDGGQSLKIAHDGKTYSVALPLAGVFQVSNALVAAAFAIGLGEDAGAVFAALAGLKGAPGRLEKVAYAKSGAPIYVDYAHTPDALENILAALRPHTKGKLWVVFGCGGDRDKGKRPLMGAMAAKYADRVIVTDDNPRSEEAAAIRREALAGCPGAQEIGDRAEAIRAGIAALGAGDVLVVAGKGHESGQIVGSLVHPFSDRDEAIKAAISHGGRPAEHHS